MMLVKFYIALPIVHTYSVLDWILATNLVNNTIATVQSPYKSLVGTGNSCLYRAAE